MHQSVLHILSLLLFGVEISAAINNLGEGTLYNVSAMIEGDNLDRMMTYVGNIESGKSGTLRHKPRSILLST